MKKLVNLFNQTLDRVSTSLFGSPALLLLAILAISLKAVYDYLAATQPHGIGIRTDSVEYIWGAINLAGGLGLGRLDGYGSFKAMTHWPPFFSIISAFFGRLTGAEIVDVMRWLNAVLTGGMVFATGIIIASLTRRAFWFTVIGTAIFATSAMVWETNLYAMSEPLYIVLALVSLLMLAAYTASEKRAWLLGSAALMGMALLTRYVGGALIITGGLVIILQKKWPLKRKILDAGLFSILAFLPMGAWAARNMAMGGTSTNRTLALVSIRNEEWQGLLSLAAGWLSPLARLGEIDIVKIALLLAASALLAWLTIKKTGVTRPENNPLAGIMVLHGLVYIVMLILARLFFDPIIPLHEMRMILPLFISVFVLAVLGLNQLWIAARKRSMPIAVVLACVLALISWSFARVYTIGSAPIRVQSAEKGLGLANVNINALPWVSFIKELPQNAIIYTDNIEMLYFPTQRYSFQINLLDENTIEKIRNDQKTNDVVIVIVNRQELIPEIDSLFPQTRLAGNPNIFILEKLP